MGPLAALVQTRTSSVSHSRFLGGFGKLGFYTEPGLCTWPLVGGSCVGVKDWRGDSPLPRREDAVLRYCSGPSHVSPCLQ